MSVALTLGLLGQVIDELGYRLVSVSVSAIVLEHPIYHATIAISLQRLDLTPERLRAILVPVPKP